MLTINNSIVKPIKIQRHSLLMFTKLYSTEVYFLCNSSEKIMGIHEFEAFNYIPLSTEKHSKEMYFIFSYSNDRMLLYLDRS